MSRRCLSLPLTAIAIGMVSLSLTGCGTGGTVSSVPSSPATPTTPPDPTPTPPVTTPPPANPGVTFGGKAMAGAQPIVGAVVQVYAVGTTGNGSSATSLLTSVLTTEATGSFTVPAAYPCPAASSQLYLLVRGGKVGTSSE